LSSSQPISFINNVLEYPDEFTENTDLVILGHVHFGQSRAELLHLEELICLKNSFELLFST
jgi:hypothetical protein